MQYVSVLSRIKDHHYVYSALFQMVEMLLKERTLDCVCKKRHSRKIARVLEAIRRFDYKKVVFYMDRSKRFTLFALPERPVHSDTNSASPESFLAMLQLLAKTKSLTCPPLSIARYSFIQLSQLGASMEITKMPNLHNGSKGDSNPGPLDWESGILPLSYRAPHYMLRCVVSYLLLTHTVLNNLS